MTRNKLILDLNNVSMEKQQAVRDRIEHVSEAGRLQCAQAFAIATSLEVTPSLVGMIADQMGTRIAKCQLGCF